VPTGFVDLDEMTRGLQPGDLVIIAARPSMGKTSLVLNIAQHVSIQPGHTVGFFSLEMSKESLFIRLLTSEAQIDSHRLMSGAIGQKDYGRISQALETLSAMRLYIDDTAGIGVLEMRAKARRLQAEHGLTLLVVDYIQLMTGRGRFENRTLELGAISRSLKGLAKELNVPIVVLSQLSRAPESRSDHRPQLSDLRESGALEQDADVVALIYRDDVYNKDVNSPDAGTAELIIAKQRNGPTGVVRLAFLREQTRFANLAQGM
jgi:replicative DNA helicase